MNIFRVQIGVDIQPTGDQDDLDAFTDLLAEQLLELDETADMIGSVLTGDFIIATTVEATDPADAVRRGTLLVRTAAHAAGGDTPQWPTTDVIEALRWLREKSVEAHLASTPAAELVPC